MTVHLSEQSVIASFVSFGQLLTGALSVRAESLAVEVPGTFLFTFEQTHCHLYATMIRCRLYV